MAETDGRGDFEPTYDQAFKRILRSPVIFAGITYFLHPDFHRFSPDRIAACAQRDACDLLVLQDSEIWQGGHVLHADRIAAFQLPLKDQDGRRPSQYLVDTEMQRSQNLSYSLVK